MTKALTKVADSAAIRSVSDAPPPSQEAARVVAPLTAIEIAVIVLAVIAVIAAARVAMTFLVPVVAGILLSYTLRPLVSTLERVRMPRIVGATLVIAVLVGSVSASVYGIRDELNDALAKLPVAARKLRLAANDARASPGPMSNVKAAAAELDRAAAEATGKPVAEPPGAAPTTHVQVLIAEQSANVLTVLAQIVVAVLIAYFLLAAGDTFRRKVTKLAGESLARRRVTVELLNEIDGQVQRYMMTLLVTNILIALVTWGGLALLHLPNAGMWGVVTGILHFIPYAGTLIAAAGVGVATFVESGGVGDAMVAMAVVLCVVEGIGVGLATWLQGRAARMNPVAVFIGVLFFGWLWGGWGLLLGMPILAVLKSVADRVEPMRPVSELLGA
jgi:predicted PurR-regulated permease PerM